MCSSYMGGVATRIPGAGQSACEGCPPAAMTRPMQTCTQGHRSRAQTVKALRQSMYGSSTSVIGKAISSSDPDFESDSPEGYFKFQCQPWSSETFIARILQQIKNQDSLYSRHVYVKTSIQSSIHPREPTWPMCLHWQKGQIPPHYFTNTAPLFRKVIRSNRKLVIMAVNGNKWK